MPPDHLAMLLNTPLPSNKQELLSLQSLFNYFRIWIPNFSLIAKPLYDAAKGALEEPLLAPSSLSPKFTILKKALIHASSLYLPNPTKPFFLCIHSHKGQALGLYAKRLVTFLTPLPTCLNN
jgi:hypothetical protein